jgi:hypothetical protein
MSWTRQDRADHARVPEVAGAPYSWPGRGAALVLPKPRAPPILVADRRSKVRSDHPERFPWLLGPVWSNAHLVDN